MQNSESRLAQKLVAVRELIRRGYDVKQSFQQFVDGLSANELTALLCLLGVLDVPEVQP